jgi:hypothetical protein
MRDSSAMKTIAVMTLVFLPATFLSASKLSPINRSYRFVAEEHG